MLIRVTLNGNALKALAQLGWSWERKLERASTKGITGLGARTGADMLIVSKFEAEQL